MTLYESMRRCVGAMLVLAAVGCSSKAPAPAAGVAVEPAPTGVWTTKAAQGKPLYATLKTSEGDITVQLFSKDAPKTVQNFVGLASGERDWTDSRSHTVQHNKPLYNGTVFHRVIPKFMIQGGDPLGTGMGDPGYKFSDEFTSGRTFDKVGLLAMANSGPNTNGSQFFITTSMPTYLNNHHTIFGEVVKGYDVAEKISNVPRGPRDRPAADVVVQSIVLSDTAP